MTEIEKFLFNVTEKSELAYLSSVNKRVVWNFRLSNDSVMSLENIANDLIQIKIDFKIIGSKTTISKSSSFVTPIENIALFLKEKIKETNVKSNIDFNKEVKNSHIYEENLDTILNGEQVDGWNLVLEKDNSYNMSKTLVIETKGFNYTMSASQKIDSEIFDLLSIIKLTTNFVIDFKVQPYIKNMTLYEGQKSQLIKDIIGIDDENKLKNNLDEMIGFLNVHAKDTELSKVLAYHKIKEALPKNNKEGIMKRKI